MKTTLRPLFRLLAVAALLLPLAGHAQDISASARQQIEALIAEKESRSPAEQKMDSQLVYLSAQEQGEPIAEGVPTLDVSVQKDADDRVLVDISGTVSESLLEAIVQSGGEVVNQFAPFDAIRAKVPVSAFEALAARADVRSIKPAALATTNAGVFLSQGDRTHRADTARTNTVATGSGIKIGVLSDGVNSLGISKSSGELNASATFLPGQAGTGDEGTAMMEIIQDLVPDAQIIFATAFGGDASMAANILALQAAGCSIIVDDVSYFNESPFQDGVISQAVNTVSAAGVMFFSSARNSGNKNDGTSGTWEGDFVSGGAVAAPVTGSGNLLDFDSGAGTTTFNTVAAGGSSRRVDLFWADSMGGSANDYDLFVLDSTGASVLRGSTNIQSGTQDPYEATGTLNIGERIVVVQRAGAAGRFIHLDTGRAVLTLSTEGNVRGHNAAGAANAFSVAATNVANSPSPNFFVGGATNPVETFSSDGPRRMFFTPNGTPITAGNFSSTGGAVLNKPDITAADGGTTAVGGFNPFFGTSAAAPHAAAIAALLKSYNPALTPAQIRTALTSTALDIEAAGNDRDSGAGIIMALEALQSVAAPNSVISGTPLLESFGLVGGPFNPTTATYTLKNTSGSPLNWTATKTQSWTTLSSPSGTLAAGASTTVICSVNAGANALPLGSYSDAVTITDTTSGLTRNFSVSLNVVSEALAQVADVTGNGGTSGFIVVGNSTYHVSESIYLDSELGTSQFLSAETAINHIAFSCAQVGTAPTVAAPHFKLYLKNVSSGTTTFATGAYDTAGYTLVYSGAYTYPTTGFWGVNLATPFVRTAGSNVQVLIERTDNATHASNIFNASIGNLLNAAASSSRRYNSTGAPLSGTTSLSSSTFRPAIRFKHVPANDVTVSLIYALGELPLGLSPTQTIRASITNTGSSTQTNLPVTLNITGANTFSDTQIIPSLASGAQTLVTFGAFTPGALGSCNLQVSVPADGDPSNNALSKPMSVTALSYSYKYPGTQDNGGAGFTGGTGTIASKFTVSSANAVTGAKLDFPSVTATTYRVAIYGDSGSNTPSTTALYTDAADRTVTAAGPVTITLPAPVAVGPGNFYIAVHQTNTTNLGFSVDNEVPLRTGTFYFGAFPVVTWTDLGLAGASLKLNMGAVLQTPAVPPEIVVYDGNGTGGAQRTDDTGTVAFGSVNVGSSSAAQTFTIQNTGTSTVNLTNLVISSTNATEFSVTQPAQTTLAPTATTTFTVTFSPNGDGARSGVVNIASNDGDENPFEINVGGTGIGIPEIAVFDGVGTGGAQRTDNTGTAAFGSVNVGSSSAAQTFTIQNTGSGDLTGIAVTSSSAEFMVDTTGMSSSLAPSATTSFTVTFSVAAGSAAGARSAVVNIASNDSNENPFEINTSGTAVAVPGAITQLGTLGTSFGTDDGTLESFTVPAGTSRALIVTASHAFESDITAVTFDGQPLTQVVEIGGGSVDGIWVRAMGTSASPTTGNIVVTRAGMDSDEQVITAAVYENVDQVTPMNAPQFFSDTGTLLGSSLVVTSEPGDIVFDLISIYASSPPSSGTPGAGQARRHGPFTGNTATWATSTKAGAASVTMAWTTTGDYIQHVAANINMAFPEIAVFNGASTAPGDARTDNTGTHAFGSVNTGSSSAAQTFTIQNAGSASLTLGTVTLTGTDLGQFSVTQPLSSSLAANATTTFTVTFSPTSTGAKSAVVNIASNDGDENLFEINVGGTGVAVATNVFYEGFEGPGFTHPGWSAVPSGYTATFPASSPPVGSNYLSLASTPNGAHLNGPIANFTSAQPDYISWRFRTPAINSTGYFVLGDSALTATNCLVFSFFRQSSGQLTFVNDVADYVHPGTLANTWYHIELKNVNYTTRTFDIWINGTPVQTAFQFRSSTLTSVSRLGLYNFNSGTGEYDEIILGAPPVASAPEIAVFNGSSTAPGDERTDNVGTFDFGSVNVGSSSAVQTFTIQNTGTATLTGITITPSNPAEFGWTPPSADFLAPGASRTFTVIFSPSAAGARGGVINIGSNDGNENPFRINVGGTGTVPTPVTTTFPYTGGVQTFTVPPGVTSITVEAFGAKGANANMGPMEGTPGTGGLGGRAAGDMAVTPGQVLYLYVGGQGSSGTGGFNGGGAGGPGGTTAESAVDPLPAGGGGGASDVRTSPLLADRVLVAGGGGGGGKAGANAFGSSAGVNGGNGGALNGTNGITSSSGGGGFGGSGAAGGAKGIGCAGFSGQNGGTATTEVGGSGGAGQACCSSAMPSGGGGGGGYVGGGGGGGGSAGTTGCQFNDKGGGGGGAAGSQYVAPALTNTSTSYSQNAGNGYIVITYGGSAGPLVFTGVPITTQSGDYIATGQDLPTREMDFTPTPGTGYTYIEVTNPANDLIGFFNDLPQGGVVAMNLNGVIYYFQANYNGGPDGNDLVLTNFAPDPAMWKWLAGPSSRNGVGIYGTLNTPAPTNNPGARQGAMNWLGQDGSLWMLGGYGYATSVTNPPRYLNDLWQYDRTLGRWIWRKGNNTPNNFGVYGTIGVEAAANNPGSRHTGTTWTDANGNLWLFGGFGVGTGVGAASLNDLWRFNRTTGNWTWMKGSTVTGAAAVRGTLGVADPANTPGARSSAAGVYSNGFLWLFGGYSGTAYYNDLWRYEIATGNWTWMSGSSSPNQNGTYGTQGTAAAGNAPGSRRDATGWLAKDGTLWFFGGLGLPATGATAGDLSDLWRYDPVTGFWTWVKGVNTLGAAGVYGTVNTPAPGNLPGARSAGSGWTTIDGDFWLVGGFKDSFLTFNDVWIYDVATNQWTWKQGAAGTLSVPGVYGTKGVAAAGNQPGGRFTPSTWVTLNGSLWIFGGGGADSFGNTGRLSDLWTYGIPKPVGTPYEDAMPADFPDALIVNADPSASDATAGTMAYVPVSGQLTGTDTDGDRILFNAAGSTTSSQGTLTLNADGTWTYTPAFGFTGVASFQFEANDDYGGQSGVKTLVISVALNPADSDGDGIADAYEQSIWGSLAAADGEGDADLDGQSNYFEFLAGTNPLNGNETLATAPSVAIPPSVAGTTSANGHVQLQLNHVRPGVNYHLETSTDLDVWSRIGTFTFSVSGSATVEDPTPSTGAPKFYRMSLEATPAVIVP